MTTWPPPMSEGLRRQLGEPVGYEPRKQAAAFVNSCLREGLSTDAIVILARGHEPCRALGESTDADGLDPALAERRLEGIIAAQREARKQAEGSPFLDWWAPPESFSEPDYCITKLIRQGDSVSIVGPPKVGKRVAGPGGGDREGNRKALPAGRCAGRCGPVLGLREQAG